MTKPSSPFAPEVAVYTFLAAFIGFLESLMASFSWVMSPSRGYIAIREILTWFRERNLWHFNQPAFLWVMEQIDLRVEKLQGTSIDQEYAMDMGVWYNREEPIPGGIKSVLQIFDWFLPIFRYMESAMVRYFGNPDKSVGGKEFTHYEAVDIVMLAVDRLYKDPHFGAYNTWGQPQAYPWVKFIRDELYEWRQALRPSAPLPPAGYEPPFSVG